MKNKLKEFSLLAFAYVYTIYLYHVKNIETGDHIEKRMLRFQKKVDRMMKRRGIALVAYKEKDGRVNLSYVPEEKWNNEKAMINEMQKQGVFDAEAKGDPIL